MKCFDPYDFQFKSLNDDPSLSEKHWQIVQDIWPAAMLNSSIANRLWNRIESSFPSTQLFLLNMKQEVVGFANTVPFKLDRKPDDLPDNGWDWLIQKSIQDFQKAEAPDTLGGLQIGIARGYQGMGLSRHIIHEVKKTAINLGYRNLVIPIRPTLKHLYPLIPMEEYMNWKEDGRIFDPWIRTHLDSGAEIIRVCPQSMTIKGTVKDWEKWANLHILGTGYYIVNGLLNPVTIEAEDGYGIYFEENIWIRYKL